MGTTGGDGTGSAWGGPRVPLPDEASESGRTDAYWAWIDGAADTLSDAAPRVAEASRGGHWVRLTCAADADYEAAHMRHSVGHSWDKYRAYGNIYSLRSAEGLPQATVLFSGGAAVHAREHQNARLSDENMAEFAAFAASIGATVMDEPPFDLLSWDEGASNTRLTYLHRAAGGTKAFGAAVFAGRATEGMVAEIAAALPGGRRFLPGDIGLEDLRADGGDPLHEIMALRHVRDEPTSDLDVEGLRAILARAAAPGAGLAR